MLSTIHCSCQTYASSKSKALSVMWLSRLLDVSISFPNSSKGFGPQSSYCECSNSCMAQLLGIRSPMQLCRLPIFTLKIVKLYINGPALSACYRMWFFIELIVFLLTLCSLNMAVLTFICLVHWLLLCWICQASMKSHGSPLHSFKTFANLYLNCLYVKQIKNLLYFVFCTWSFDDVLYTSIEILWYIIVSIDLFYHCFFSSVNRNAMCNSEKTKH